MTPPVSLPPASAIARRDLLEFVRDRRAVVITFLLPLIAYPLVALATVLGLRTALEQIDGSRQPLDLKLVLTGSDAPAIAARIVDLRDAPDRSGLEAADAWPASLTVAVAATPEQAVESVAAGTADAWIEVPGGTARALQTLGAATLPLRATSPAIDTEGAILHLNAVFESLADAIRRERMARLQVPLSLFEPIQLAVAPKTSGGTSVAEAESVVSTVASSLLMILTLLTVTGAFHPAADAFAGEKERGTIETLLVAPCGIGQVVRGKFFAVYGVTLATLVANLVAISGTAAVGVRALPENLQGLFAAAPSLPAVLTAVATQAVLAAVAAAACLAITSSLRSLKEAHHALTTVMLAVSVLAAAGLVPMPLPSEAVAMMPVAGQVLVARLALTGEPIGLLLPLTILAAVGWCWILLQATAAALANEDVIFRGPDAAGGLLQRPFPRRLPTPVQGVLPAIVGLAGVWYVQSVLPDNLAVALPFQQLFSMVLPLVAMLAWQRVDLSQTLRLSWPSGRGWASVPGAVFLGVGLFLLGAMTIRWIVGSEPSAAADELAGKLTSLLTETPAWLAVLVLAVIPAVCEEFVFRGWMLSAFTGERPSPGRQFAAVVTQAALFGVVHLLPERLPTTFAMGLVLGWMALHTGSLLPGIVCHAVHNAVPVGVSLLAETSLDSLEISPPALAAAGMLAAGIGVGLVVMSGQRLLSAKKG
jgi:sodium transport system permease protein